MSASQPIGVGVERYQVLITVDFSFTDQDAATKPTAYDFGRDGVQVWECVGQGYADPGAYCCESAGEKTRCCRTQTAVFSLPGASIGNALAVQTFPLPDTETLTTDSTTPTTTGPTTPKTTSSGEKGQISGTENTTTKMSLETGEFLISEILGQSGLHL
jgi:hypothetical protein